MLVAIIVTCFVLGFGTAIVGSTEPRKTRTSLQRFFQNIRIFFEWWRCGPSSIQTSLPLSIQEDDNADRTKFLLTRSQVEEQFEVGSWQQVAYEEFSSTLLARERDAKKFPCVYATKGLRANDHLYIFIDSDNPSEPRNVRHVGAAIREYLEEAHKLGPNTSLVIICGPSETIGSVEEYNRRFWGLLRGLRIMDSKPWPKGVPANTTDAHWTFCFNGEPLFPIALTPAHERRRSRYASNLMIAMQPKWVIDNLMSTPEKRKSATSTVRGLLKDYDDVEISPDLSDFGVLGASESRQLTLLDENRTSECPYENFDI